MTIRSFEDGDRVQVHQLMQQLQAHISGLDKWGMERTVEDFDVEKYVQKTLDRVEDNAGQFLVAEEGDVILGFIVGGVGEYDEMEALMCYPTCFGEVYELCVDSAQRGRGLGRQLMEAMELYFKDQGCVQVLIDVYAPNIRAHHFYEALGYENIMVQLVKQF